MAAVGTWLRRYWPYALLTTVIMLPLLMPGYILTLDAVFTPRISAPASVSSDYVWRWLLHILNMAVPSQVIEKAIFVAIPLLAGVGMHCLLSWLRRQFSTASKNFIWDPALYVGGILYVANPFTYDRFMAGQYGVLMGYALVPFIVRLLLQFMEKPTLRRSIKSALLAVAISIVSLPTIGEVALLVVCVFAVAVWRQRRQPAALRAYAKYGATAALVFCVLSSYWLIPALLGKGIVASQVETFTAAHTQAFATTGSSVLAQLAAVLRLQGFWAEPHHLFMLPQDHTPAWGTIRLVMWAGVVTGAILYWRRASRFAAIFTLAGAASALLAAGIFGGALAHVGYREPQKFAGVLALVFAVFIACAAARLFAWARARSETQYVLAAGAALFLVLIWTSTMYWGFAAQLRPRQYPQDWAAANRYLTKQQGDFNTVFLPWHQYMSFSFAGRIIATPAAHYFDKPVIVSNDPELGSITPPAGALATQIGHTVKPGSHSGNIAQQLARANVRYILLAKDYDFAKYQYLDGQPGLRRVMDSPKISIYENKNWKGAR
ncbi:MAG TPA: hypothetical protein VLF62_04815 [Candidatus Saccharimonadales bacterium]|nr:hypothetical protein [Candidatus Saccharimonadales bacterium]